MDTDGNNLFFLNMNSGQYCKETSGPRAQCCISILLYCGLSDFFPQIPDHIKDDCPLTIISCRYENMGCETKVCNTQYNNLTFRLAVINLKIKVSEESCTR